MTNLVRGGALLGLLWLCVPSTAHATNLPWCGLTGDVGTPVCAYATFEQCRMSARSCMENDYPSARAQASKSQLRRTAHGTRGRAEANIGMWG